jgi:hypothetical protein
MERRTARLRREYLYRKARESRDTTAYEEGERIRTALDCRCLASGCLV